MALLVSRNVEKLFQRATLTNGSAKVPNESPALEQAGVKAFLVAAANALGVAFEATGHTFRLTTANSGGVKVYGPFIAKGATEPVLCWGDTRTPLSQLRIKPSLDLNDGLVYACFEFPEPLEHEYDVLVPLMLAKDADGKPVADYQELKSLMRKGDLNSALAAGVERPVALRDVTPGVYKVTGWSTDSAFGETRYILEVQGVGKVKCNTTLARQLVDEPLIDPEHPATLTVMESTQKTRQGHPIIPVTLFTWEDADLPVFTF